MHVLGLCGVLRQHVSELRLELVNLVGLVGTQRIVVPRFCT